MTRLNTLIIAGLLLAISAVSAFASVMPSGYVNYNPLGTIDPTRSVRTTPWSTIP
jgi:hypothetical protein